MIRIEQAPIGEDHLNREIACFIQAHPAATAYAMPEWMAMMSRFRNVEARYHVAIDAGLIVGVLPITYRPFHSWAASLLAGIRPIRCESLGHDGYAGPLIAPDLDEARTNEVLNDLLQSFSMKGALLKTLFPPAWLTMDRIRQRLITEHNYYPRHGYPIAVKHLEGLSETSVFATYHKNHRGAVEAARKRGVEVTAADGVGDYLEFYDLLDETMHHAGTAPGVSKDMVVVGGQDMVRAGLGQLWIARVDGSPVAGVFVLHAAKTTCYWLGASAKDPKILNHRPMHALLHHAFLEAIARGSQTFELGGLITEGLRIFKTHWGARVYEQCAFEWSYRNLIEPLRDARSWLDAGARRLKLVRLR